MSESEMFRVSKEFKKIIEDNHNNFQKKYKKNIYLTDYTTFLANQLKGVNINQANILLYGKHYTIVKRGRRSNNIFLRSEL